MKAHQCRESDVCSCSLTALEPDERCPIHDAGIWPPRCAECGRFLPWKWREREPDTITVEDNGSLW